MKEKLIYLEIITSLYTNLDSEYRVALENRDRYAREIIEQADNGIDDNWYKEQYDYNLKKIEAIEKVANILEKYV